MIVPYRDSSEDHYRRTAFDIGEWGLGFMTTSLELGCDCLGEIRYLDAVLHNSKGEPYTITNAVCIHEEDNAVLWKHVDHDVGAEVRRMRRLTMSFHVTVANYEYLIYWRLYQDGNIECEIRATGIMVTTPLAPGQPHPNGTLVDERTYAPFHQHFLVARLDMDIDGSDNTVFMTESHAEPMGPDNPYGLSLVTRNVPLRTESEGKQDVNFATQRTWKVVNTNVVNGLGTHPSYKLVPSGAIPPMFDPDSPVIERASVIGHTLWVTPNQSRRALACRRIRQPVGTRHRSGRVDAGQPVHREHRCGDVVRVRHPPHHPAGGLAGDARRHGVVLAQAVRILRPQPVAGRGRDAAGHVPHRDEHALVDTCVVPRFGAQRPDRLIERPPTSARMARRRRGARSSDFAFERIGTGQMSECYRVALTYADGDGGPNSVVLKVAASDPVSRQTGLALGLYEREVRFYTDIAPRPRRAGRALPPRRRSTPRPARSICCWETRARPSSATKSAARQSNRPCWR